MLDFDKIENMKRAERQNRQQQYKEKSLSAMKNIARKRCTTIFIGALDSIEQKFGYQWGVDKNTDELTEKEVLFRQLWQVLRKEILDKSNHQLKEFIRELDNFEVELKKNFIESNIYE